MMVKGTPPLGQGIDQNLRRTLESISEASDVGAGLRGDPLQRYIRVEDLIDLGLAKRLGNRAQRLVSGQNLIPTNPPIMDIPPQPQNFEVTGGLGIIFLSWDSARAAYLNHSYTSVYRAETDNLAIAVEIQQATDSFGAIDPTAVYGTTYFYWIRFVSGDDIAGPWNDAVGTEGKQADDPTIVLDILTGEITESQLFADLQSRIDLIDTPSTGLVDQSIANAEDILGEITARAALASQLRGIYTGTDPTGLASGLLHSLRTETVAGLSTLTTQMALLTAGTNSQFDQVEIWYFDSTIEGWTGNGTPTLATVGWLRPANHATDPYVISPTIAVDGTKYPQVRVRIKKVGSPVWEGHCYYVTAADSTYDTTKRVTLTEPSYDSGVGFVTWNMTGAWIGGTITHILLSLSANQDASNYFEIDWVAIGRPSPGASSAEVYLEELARVAGDSANASSIAALTTTVGGKASSSALSALDSRVTTAEGTLTSQASDIASLSTTLTGKASSGALSALDSRVTTTESSLTTQASQISSLNTSVAGKASSSAVSGIDSRVTTAEGVIASHSSQITSLGTDIAGKASSGAVSALDSRVTSVEGINTSQASAITTVTTTVAGHTSTISVQQTSINGLTSQYMVKTDVNGLVSGFGLYSDGATSMFGISVDRFFIGSPGKSSFALVVDSGRVVMDGALIKNLTVNTAQIGSLAVTSAKIASAAINDLHVGTLTVDTILGDVSGVYSLSTTSAIDFGQYSGSGSGTIKGGQIAVGTIVVPSRTRSQGLSVWISGSATKGSTGNGFIKAEFYEPGPGGAVLSTLIRLSGQQYTGTEIRTSASTTGGLPASWLAVAVGDLIRVYINSSNFVEGIVEFAYTAGGAGSYTRYIAMKDVFKLGTVTSDMAGATIQQLAPASRLYKIMNLSCGTPVVNSGDCIYSTSFYDLGSRLAISRNILCTIGFYSTGTASTFINKSLNIAIVAGR